MFKPIIKYYGGKRKDAKHIVPLIRENLAEDGTYFEPFVGGGAVWLSLGHDKNVVGDIVPDLINMYDCIRENPEEVLEYYSQFKNNEDEFYKIRSLDRQEEFDSISKFFKAARYIYLTKTSFGSITFNSDGQANQSYYKLSERGISLNQKDYNNVHAVLQNTETKLQSFEETLKQAKQGDFVYLDPPYIESRYDRYYTEKFTFDDMKRLKQCCDDLTERGVKFALSHSKNEKVNELFKDYKRRELNVERRMRHVMEPDYIGEQDYLITNF